MTSTYKNIVLIDDDGVTLATYGGALVIRSREIKLIALPKNTRKIIMDGYGSITTSAINVAASKHVEILIASRSHGTMSLFAPTPLKSMQAVRHSRSASSSSGQCLIRQKRQRSRGQLLTRRVMVEWSNGSSMQQSGRCGQRTLFATRKQNPHKSGGSNGPVLSWHSKGQACPLSGVRFNPGILGELGAQFTARNAIHPMQAMLNYAIGVLAARMTRVLIAQGFDCAFGFLHDGRKPGRLSLVWDCVELHRPVMIRAVFEMTQRRTFKKNDFGIFEKDGVGLLPPLAREVTEIAVRTVTLRDMVRTADWVARLL